MFFSAALALSGAFGAALTDQDREFASEWAGILRRPSVRGNCGILAETTQLKNESFLKPPQAGCFEGTQPRFGLSVLRHSYMGVAQPQVLVHVSTFQGSILEFWFFEPQPYVPTPCNFYSSHGLGN